MPTLINGEQVKKIGYGEFATVYRSICNPDTVYIVTPSDDPVKELLSHIKNTKHIPAMQYVDDAANDKVIWQTEYSETLAKKHGAAYDLGVYLNKAWDTFRYAYSNISKDKWYVLCADFIDSLKTDQNVPESLTDALEAIYIWATAFSPSFLFEFPRRNLSIDANGDLLLRDVIYFR